MYVWNGVWCMWETLSLSSRFARHTLISFIYLVVVPWIYIYGSIEVTFYYNSSTNMVSVIETSLKLLIELIQVSSGMKNSDTCG
jgi:hypothetical protein